MPTSGRNLAVVADAEDQLGFLHGKSTALVHLHRILSGQVFGREGGF